MSKCGEVWDSPVCSVKMGIIEDKEKKGICQCQESGCKNEAVYFQGDWQLCWDCYESLLDFHEPEEDN